MACIVHFLPAKAGDCFVLEFDNKDCILIDCGYVSTYKKELKPLLLQLRAKGCRLILFLITHIDQDHISGAIQFLQENGQQDTPQIIAIENIWFNGFFNTVFSRPEFEKRRTACLSSQMICRQKWAVGELLMQTPGEDGPISVFQSKCFETLCAKNGYVLNRQFPGQIVQQTCKTREEMRKNEMQFGDIYIRVLGPGKEQLDQLAQRLDRTLIQQFGSNYQLTEDESFGILFELLMGLHASYPDISEPICASKSRIKDWLGTSSRAKMSLENQSSIVVEIEYMGLRLLFLGDAETEDFKCLLAPHYDLIKLSHHGTLQPNLALLENSIGDTLLISTDGVKRHPEDELLARAILAGNRALYFNYNITRKDDLLAQQAEYGFSAHFQEREIVL